MDDPVDSFIKNTHSSNSTQAANAKILIPAGVVIILKSILYELKGREHCHVLPNAIMLAGLDPAQITVIRAQRSLALHDAEQDQLATLPVMTIPKLTTTNYEALNTALVALATRTMGTNGTTLDYLTGTIDGNYDDPWDSCSAKLNACTALSGPNFRRDREALYSLFVQHVGTKLISSNIVKQFKTSKDGYRCYHAFEAHFKNDAYLENKATIADQAIQNAQYSVDRKTFTMESYYIVMSNVFNDLSQSGAAHALNEQQKVTKFENGLKDTTAISWSITAKNHWNSLPVANQTFDTYYNEFLKYMTKFKTMSTPDTRSSHISALDTTPQKGGGRQGGRQYGRSN